MQQSNRAGHLLTIYRSQIRKLANWGCSSDFIQKLNWQIGKSAMQ